MKIVRRDDGEPMPSRRPPGIAALTIRFLGLLIAAILLLALIWSR